MTRKNGIHRALAAFLLLILLLSQAQAEIYLDTEPPADWADRDDLMRVTAFATLINDCTLIEVGGRSMLVDGGVRKWREQLVASLAELGYDGHVDVLFNTHPHDDHVQAVTYMVREGFRADEFWSSFPETHRSDIQKRIVKALKNAEIPYHQLSQMETVDFGGATLVFYWWEGGKDPNARSCLMHVTFGGATLLMTADATGATQNAILKTVPPEFIRADVMKMPHHGIVPCPPAFLEAVNPGFIFVTNRKSSTPKSTNQLLNEKIPFYNTTLGRVVMVTDGTDWYIKQYRDMF